MHCEDNGDDQYHHLAIVIIIINTAIIHYHHCCHHSPSIIHHCHNRHYHYKERERKSEAKKESKNKWRRRSFDKQPTPTVCNTSLFPNRLPITHIHFLQLPFFSSFPLTLPSTVIHYQHYHNVSSFHLQHFSQSYANIEGVTMIRHNFLRSYQFSSTDTLHTRTRTNSHHRHSYYPLHINNNNMREEQRHVLSLKYTGRIEVKYEKRGREGVEMRRKWIDW